MKERTEMRDDRQQSAESKPAKRGMRVAAWAALVFCAIALMASSLLAKYVTESQERAEMESSGFHISSNYLEEISQTYTVADWGDGFDILLYNYEKENVAQVSEVDMTYTVTVSEGTTVSVTDQASNVPDEDNDDIYTFGKFANTTYHTLHVTPGTTVSKGDKITVTVTTVAPYKKMLTATFSIARNSKPDYTIEDQGNGTVLVTVKTNDYADIMKVTWDPDKLSPDNTNILMAAWKDENPTGTFTVESNSTYELLFFKKSDEDVGKTSGTGTEITLS
ncbi:hypothetical protein [Adlercreutzia sp. ZJ242]|uniref:hypothetical protein n=1 Tax=Adlercreutzia sp. ZJ242 TaxID=2709409 RepID=UPI0013ED4242|nr:hypothetical protein [Adlercreutzia sp. ZJ242]